MHPTSFSLCNGLLKLAFQILRTSWYSLLICSLMQFSVLGGIYNTLLLYSAVCFGFVMEDVEFNPGDYATQSSMRGTPVENYLFGGEITSPTPSLASRVALELLQFTGITLLYLLLCVTAWFDTKGDLWRCQFTSTGHLLSTNCAGFLKCFKVNTDK